jgi:hypothetical protein
VSIFVCTLSPADSQIIEFTQADCGANKIKGARGDLCTLIVDQSIDGLNDARLSLPSKEKKDSLDRVWRRSHRHAKENKLTLKMDSHPKV